MSRFLPDFAGLFCLATLLLFFGTTNDILIRDGDTFLHIATGKHILAQHEILDKDIFSHTAYGQPWTAHEWLAGVLMAAIDEFSGIEGLISFHLLLASLSLWLLFRLTQRHANHWISFGLLSIVFIFSPYHLAARPHMFTWVLMILTYYLLSTGGKRLYWLPIITAIWCNLHGGFVIGLALQVLFILGTVFDHFSNRQKNFKSILKSQKHKIIILVLSLAVTGFNPFGYELLLFPFQLTDSIAPLLPGEWQAPDLRLMWYFRYFIIATVLLVSLRENCLNWTERLLLVFFLNAALAHVRHMILMIFIITPTLAKIIETNLPQALNRHSTADRTSLKLSASSGPLLAVAITIVLMLNFSNNPATTFLTPEKLFYAKVKNLEGLVDHLQTSMPEGNVFNHYNLGGYLIYKFPERIKVFIDGRADMYRGKILRDYDTIRYVKTGWKELFDLYNLEWVIYDTGSELIKSLAESGQWKTEYSNANYTVLSKMRAE